MMLWMEMSILFTQWKELPATEIIHGILTIVNAFLIAVGAYFIASFFFPPEDIWTCVLIGMVYLAATVILSESTWSRRFYEELDM